MYVLNGKKCKETNMQLQFIFLLFKSPRLLQLYNSINSAIDKMVQVKYRNQKKYAHSKKNVKYICNYDYPVMDILYTLCMIVTFLVIFSVCVFSCQELLWGEGGLVLPVAGLVHFSADPACSHRGHRLPLWPCLL